MSPNDLCNEFKQLFGEQPNGCKDDERLYEVLHCKTSPRIVKLCRDAMGRQTAELFDFFQKWDETKWDEHKGDRNPHRIEQLLVTNGRWEAAWSLARLHVDQVAKQEAATGQRVDNKGHPLCGLALIGQALGCPALVRHYAQLSSAGDFYYPSNGKEVPHGLAPVLLEPHESRKRHEGWRGWVGQQLAEIDPKRPLFLEAYLAARWFRSQHQKSITKLATMAKGDSRSFVEVLLDAVVAWTNTKDTTGQGTLFEAAAGLLLSATPGFTVYPCRWDKDEQIDLVVRYDPDSIAPPCLPLGYGLVECKSEAEAVDSATLRDFGTKCLFHRVQFGILVARSGITGGGVRFKNPTGAELARRRFLSDGLALLVLDIDHLRGQDREPRGPVDRELRGLHDALFDDYQRLVFGRIVGEE